MKCVDVALALINTKSGKHVVVHRKLEDNYGFPGGKKEAHEKLRETLVREVMEETGLLFLPQDFDLISIQERKQEEKLVRLYTYACRESIPDDVPLFTAEPHIVPMLMEPMKFYQVTKFKEYYDALFENLGKE